MSLDSGNQQHLLHHQSLQSFLNQLLKTLCLGFLFYDYPPQYTTTKSASGLFSLCSHLSIGRASSSLSSEDSQMRSRMDYSVVSLGSTTKCSFPLVNQRRMRLPMKGAEASLCNEQHLQSSRKEGQALLSSVSSSSLHNSISQAYFYKLPLPNEPPFLLKHPLLSTTTSTYHPNHSQPHYSPFHVLGSFLINYFSICLFLLLRPQQVFRDLGLFILYQCSPSATHCDVHSFSSSLSPRRLLFAFKRSILLVILIGTTFSGKFFCVCLYVKQKNKLFLSSINC